MTILVLHPIGAARLISAVLKYALCGTGWYGVNDPARMRRRAEGIGNILRNGVVDHYCNVYPIHRDRIEKALLAKAAQLLEEAERITRKRRL